MKGSMRLAGTVVCLLFFGDAFALSPPNGGQILQQEQLPPTAPLPSPSLDISSPVTGTVQPGGAKVRIEQVRFTGNTVFTGEQLGAVLGQVRGRDLDLAGLQGLARKVTNYYRKQGYPFARAYLPAQKVSGGVISIAVVEGRYGQVKVEGEARLAAGARSYLSGLKHGEVIELDSLERSVLLLTDLPGIHASPLVRPGRELGEGDLLVKVERGRALTGEIRGDNHGNRFTGEYRGHVSLQWNSPFTLGDQLSTNGFVSENGQWLGDIDYRFPLGTSGLRGRIGYAHTYYDLGGQFAALDATGKVDMTSLGLSYPVIRSQQRNLSLVTTWRHKWLEDRQGATHTTNNKRSDTLPLILRFDLHDSLLGGGLSYGELSWTGGDLHLDSALKAIDATTARTEGRFYRLNLDVARLQVTPIAALSLYGRFAGQLASKNLDSSEEFGLGGPYGVRAYPVGEGFGDEGWLVQLEARYQAGSVTPYLLYDAGSVTINHHPYAPGDNHRTISGAGVGLRATYKAIDLDVSMAWQISGGPALSDTNNHNPRLWFSAGWRF